MTDNLGLRKQLCLLAPRRLGHFGRGDICVSATEILY